ncbi:TPA: DUF2586 family protein [Escherichia coli]|nr:DUF2586 family protein [Escherichia coli]
MTWPIVTVNQVNQLLGETNEVERTLLFIGTGIRHCLPVHCVKCPLRPALTVCHFRVK